MIYEPKILYNPTDRVIEFSCRGSGPFPTIYRFEPKEKRNLEGYVAHHALVEVNTGLKEHEGESTKLSTVKYDTLAWGKLLAIGSARGLYKPGQGITKRQLIDKLIQLDEQESIDEGGVIQGSPVEEEG